MPTVTVPKAIDAGLRNIKANFWPFILIILILGIVDSIGNGPAVRRGMETNNWWMFTPMSGGFLSFVIGMLIKPVLDYGANLVFIRGNRGEEVDVREIITGFDSKDLYIDIVLTNILIIVCVVGGLIFLVLPGIYIACRTLLAPYLVIDKGLAPQQALKASWELMRDFWPLVILLGIVAIIMFIGGLILLVVGLIPAFAWIKAMFADFYQQVIDAHDEDFLRSLDIEP